MFSLDNFYDVLYTNLLKPCNLVGLIADVNSDIIHRYPKTLSSVSSASTIDKDFVFFYDQEPLLPTTLIKFTNTGYFFSLGTLSFHKENPLAPDKIIFANSEISDYKNEFVNYLNLNDWYYFSHGFIALDWFRDAKYLVDKTNSFDKVFIMYNNLILKDRSYRLGIVADILARDLKNYGLISLPLVDPYHGALVNEIFDTNSLLTKSRKHLILETIHKLKTPLTIDTSNPNGTFSAKINLQENQRAFWHIVPETNFYHPKLHLTEKIFKPIVSYRPFILASYAGNLKYLRSYGFKTFGDFIDESYDDETDNDKRMTMIVDEIEKLCKLTLSQQKEMFDAMKPILEHNFSHFFGKFKKIIVDEMVYGFGECIENSDYDDSAIDYAAVAAKLIS
jgi:hypothetical protein